MPRKVFTAGEVLAATDVNNFLMDQTVMTFAGTAARGTAIPTPAEGMYAHLNDTDTLTYYDGSAWVNRIGAVGILQVVGATKTDVFSTNSPTFTTVTGLTATITPSSASSKILVLVDAKIGTNNAVGVGSHIRITGGNAATYIGDAASSRARTAFSVSPSQANWGTGLGVQNAAITFLDSPATTSSITYAVEQRRGASSQFVFVNRTGADTDNDDYGRFASSITLMEVAG
jgi:hypothetical protein